MVELKNAHSDQNFGDYRQREIKKFILMDHLSNLLYGLLKTNLEQLQKKIRTIVFNNNIRPIYASKNRVAR